MNESTPTVGRPPKKVKFKCVARDMWTSEGRVKRGESIELPAKEVEKLNEVQDALVQKLIDKK
ncbi:MAG: hypothetical protein JAY60_18490 [Candidatus Thiodiazotropha weberae]|nr:hypothetical protein [Candidatus Thiodiazotropha weberae]